MEAKRVKSQRTSFRIWNTSFANIKKEGKDNTTADSQISTESQRLGWTRRLAKRMNGKGISNRGFKNFRLLCR